MNMFSCLHYLDHYILDSVVFSEHFLIITFQRLPNNTSDTTFSIVVIDAKVFKKKVGSSGYRENTSLVDNVFQIGFLVFNGRKPLYNLMNNFLVVFKVKIREETV